MGIIGAPIDRREARVKVMGAARYAAEFPVADLVHAVLVQSTIAAGAILAIDTDEAGRMPGVLAVITPDNALRLRKVEPSGQTVTAPTLQNRDILYNGQHIAIVVADTLERAQDAASRVRVRYREDEPAVEIDELLSQAWVPKHFRNGARDPVSRRGDPESAFEAAPVRVDVTYSTPVEHHNPMEPHATIAHWEGDQLTVWTATQGISGARDTLAKLFGLKPEQVRVFSPYLGGGFGCKGNTWPPATLTAMAARQVGRPVKLVLSRAQMFTSNGYRPRTIQRLRLGADKDGTLFSLRHDGFSQMSDPVLGEFAEPVGLASEMLYAAPAVAVTHRLVSVNQGLPTYMRAPGEASGVFALECAMDELAVALKMDPIALRLKNYAEIDPHEGKPFSTKKLHECYQLGAEAFGWSRRIAAPRSMRDGDVLIGWGMATSTYPVNRSPAGAIVRMGADGSVIVRSGTQDIGTGTYTVMTQVTADTLKLPVTRVRAVLGDTALPQAPVSGGSQTAASVGNAVFAAALALKARVIELARRDTRAGLAGVPEGALRFEHGVVIGAGKRVRLDELLAHNGLEFIEAEADVKPGTEKEHFSMHAFGAQFAEVRVDEALGEIRVSRYVGAFDVGRVVNAKTARSQLIGGITYGLGMALLERTVLDPEMGRIVNANLVDYLVPVNADVPAITTILVENDDGNANPLGVKGMGELPMVGVAAAVANAVFHATGRRVRDLPISPEHVLA